MAKRPVLSDITSLTNSSNINVINQNWDAIQEAFDNTVSRDGSIPNTMSGDLDLNGNALLNVGTIDVNNLTLEGQQVTDLASVPEWRSAWLTGTSYIKNDLVKTNGNVYICLVSHTSGTFATDLTALKWELMVSKGDSGAGTGDVVAANNLSDLTNVATARANLGLGTAAVENTVPVSKGGTGATDAATALVNLGLGDVATDDIVPIVRGGTGQALADPGGQRVLGWDDTNNRVDWFTAGSGVSLTGNSITVSGSSITDAQLDTGAATAAGITWVGLRTAGLALGAVGSYGLFRRTVSANVEPGVTVAGSELRYVNAAGDSTAPNVTPSGTWRLMGNLRTGSTESLSALFLRIS